MYVVFCDVYEDNDFVNLTLLSLLMYFKSTINYPTIAQQVAQYNKDSFKAWINVTNDCDGKARSY